MVLRSALAAVGLGCAFCVAAAPEWHAIAQSGTVSAYIDQQSLKFDGPQVHVSVLRNYGQSVVLGHDAATGSPWYPHRSVKLTYTVNCATSQVAMREWQMFDGNFGNGDVVWAERRHGVLNFNAASDMESRAVQRMACATRTVSR